MWWRPLVADETMGYRKFVTVDRFIVFQMLFQYATGICRWRCLKCAREHGCPWDEVYLRAYAASGGHHEVLGCLDDHIAGSPDKRFCWSNGFLQYQTRH
jgi:hypothetical protein